MIKNKVITYTINELQPYIDWMYFFYAWSMNGKADDAKAELKTDALELLDEMNGKYHAQGVFSLYDANGDGDDIVIGNTRLPLLRQQKEKSDGNPNICLSDFLRPLSSGIKDMLGIFATSVDQALVNDYKGDPYTEMLAQTLADRLAEATAERLHEDIRKHHWGYAPDEQLSMEELLQEKYQGIRPAIGYPSLPDTSMNFLIAELVDMSAIGIVLTENGMMIPHASVSGLMFAHPKSFYFDLGKIGEDQLNDYARRRNMPTNSVRKFLQTRVIRK